MKRIPLSQAPAGSVLAQPVIDGSGREIMKAGATLSPVWLDRLAVRKISEVVIAEESTNRARDESGVFRIDPSDESSSVLSPDDALHRANVESSLNRLLEGVEDSALVGELHQVALRYFADRQWKIEE